MDNLDSDNNVGFEGDVVANEYSEKPMSFISRVVNMFISPTKVMANIKVYPKVIDALIFVIFLAVISAYLMSFITPITIQRMSEISIERYGSDIFSVSESLAASSSTWSNPVTYISTIIGVIFFMAISSFLWWIFAKLLKGTASFGQTFSMLLHVNFVIYFLAIITGVIQNVLMTDVNVLSLHVFVPNAHLLSFTYIIMQFVSVSTIWGFFLNGTGISVINNFSKTKGFALAFVALLLSVVFSYLSINTTFWITDMTFGKL